MACCGDAPTLETLAAVSILQEKLPELKIRVVNVVDLMRLQDVSQHPHGLSQSDYDMIFTKDKPILFAYHGYPSLIHELTYRRANKDLHVRGYKEEGTITTPFDMRVQNDIDRFHLVIDAIKLIPSLSNKGAAVVQEMKDKLQYVTHFYMDFAWRSVYVGIMEAYVDGIHYYFIDNEEYFTDWGPYSSEVLVDVEKFIFYSKANFCKKKGIKSNDYAFHGI